MADSRVSDVLAVLPSLDTARIKVLLDKYGSVEEVINRCLDGLPEVEVEDVVDLDSNSTTATAEYDIADAMGVNNDDVQYANGLGSPNYPVVRTFVVDDPDPLQYHDADQDLPDIPDSFESQDILSFQQAVAVTEKPVAASNALQSKPKGRGRKKKDEEGTAEPVIRDRKKKLPTNVANVEVQIGTSLFDKSDGLSEAVFKALEVNGGVFEKNAALPCPCNVSAWEDAIHPFAVRWIYHRPVAVLENDDDSDAVYAAPGSEFVAELQSELCILLPLDDFIGLCRKSKDNDLTAFCRRITYAMSDNERFRRIVIITPDPEQYFKQRYADQKRQFRQKVTGNESAGSLVGQDISLEDIEMAIACLDFADPALPSSVTVSFSTSNEHTAAMVRCITKAVCDRPGKASKRQWDSALVMEPGCTVNPAEKPFELWCRQLEQLALVSSDVASAIAARFPSPMSLHCAATAEGHLFAADLEIRRGAGVLERTRRVGPETSRRLHMLFTADTDPETVFE